MILTVTLSYINFNYYIVVTTQVNKSETYLKTIIKLQSFMKQLRVVEQYYEKMPLNIATVTWSFLNHPSKGHFPDNGAVILENLYI